MLGRPPRVGVAAHDLRFFAPVDGWLRQGGAVLRYDRWWGHHRHDPDRGRELARWADVLVCEWCLGNARFHSALRTERGGLPPRLIVRLHRFELTHPYGGERAADAVALFVVPADHVRDEALARFCWPPERTVVVPNPVDVGAFDTAKSAEAATTLGMVGWDRSVKRPDLALDLLERLRADDPRWRLRLKGQRPEEVGWVWEDPDERAFFEALYARIEGSPDLRDAVVMDGFGPVAEWFRDVGYVLSTSDVESFHLGAAEGMAAGSVPVFLPRAGVAELFADQWLHPDVDAAAAQVQGLAADPQRRRREGEQARAIIAERYDTPSIAEAWRRIVLDRG